MTRRNDANTGAHASSDSRTRASTSSCVMGRIGTSTVIPPSRGAPASMVVASAVADLARMHPVGLQVREPLPAALAADRAPAHPLGDLVVARPLARVCIGLHRADEEERHLAAEV